MSKELEKIKNLIGEESLERVFEVMGLLGVSFPESFDIYDKAWGGLDGKDPFEELHKDWYESYAVVLSGDEPIDDHTPNDILDKLGCFEFNEYHQTISIIKDGIFYEWKRNGNKHESINVRQSYGNELSAFYNRRDDGLVTSDIGMRGKYDFPVIRSYINRVTVNDRTIEYEAEAPIELYYDLFQQVFTDPRLSFLIPESLKREDILTVITQVLKRPIEDIVAEIKNTDQSWRYEKEKELANSRCESEKDKAKRELDEIVAKAKRAYKWALHKADDEKFSKLDAIDKEFEEYKASRSVNSSLSH